MSRSSHLRKSWEGRAGSWDAHVTTSPAFSKILDAILTAAAPHSGDVVVDLGCGSGFVSLPIAPRVRSVLGIDFAPSMLTMLKTEAEQRRLPNITTLIADLATLELQPDSCDLIVSSYVLHHLTDDQKADLLLKANEWLRPGGRIVICDIMLGRGATAEDRAIIRGKIAVLLRKGPGGIWRIVKNLVRYGLRRGSELPAPPEFWTNALTEAGFCSVRFERVVNEAGLVYGVGKQLTSAKNL